MGNLCFKEETEEGYKRIETEDEEYERVMNESKQQIKNLKKENLRREKEVMEEYAQLQEEQEKINNVLAKPWQFNSIPRRRMRLRKTAAKRKSKTIHSQHGKRKIRKH